MSMLGTTIRELRTEYGFSLDEVARLAALARERLERIEAGEPPTVRELAVIGNAFAVDPAALHSGRVTQSRRTVARFRAPTGVTELSGHDARLLALAAECGRIGAALARMLGRALPITAAREIRGINARPPAWKQGYTLGSAARQQLAPDHQALASVQGWMESVGVHVAMVEFESVDVEAASVFEPGAMPVVLLDARADRVKNPLSRRAILGHELCHLLHDGGERDLTIVSRDHDDSSFEQRANGFAPSFLAPGEWVKVRECQPEKLAVAIAETWGLTYEGAVWHAKNLRKIDAATADRLIHGRRPRVRARDFEPALPRTPPAQFEIDAEAGPLTEGLLSELAIQAFVDGHISRGRAREVLALR
jgi:transcriptional regulator with XRE-family HTH domain/Zn-dependent peptidase ImmA (M78 family)